MIRHARISDLQQVRFLAQTNFAPYALNIAGPVEPFDMDLWDMVEKEEIAVYIVENAIRGFICYHIDGPDVHIRALGVAPRYRRKGVGRMLLDFADLEGLKRGCRRAVFHTNAQMFENLAYFRGKGFQETDRRQVDGYEQVYLERYLR